MTLHADLPAYLATATGLAPERAAALYRIGEPWPLYTTQDARRATVYAQAHGIPFPQALAIITELAETEVATILDLFARLEHVHEAAERTAMLETIMAVPVLKEILDHCRHVAQVSQEPFPLVYRLSHAIQLFSEEHPDWDPDGHGVGPAAAGCA